MYLCVHWLYSGSRGRNPSILNTLKIHDEAILRSTISFNAKVSKRRHSNLLFLGIRLVAIAGPVPLLGGLVF